MTLTGSVFGDDSSVLVDGNNNKIVGPVETASLRTSETKIALGEGAGETTQGNSAVAIGDNAGKTTQGAGTVAIGYQAGKTTQGEKAVALGNFAGSTSQGAHAIAIGDNAGEANQAANSIVINATGSAVQNTTASSLVIKPVRDAVGTTMLMYDATSGEVTHTASPVITGDITGSVFGDDSTVLVDGVAGKIVGPISRIVGDVQQISGPGAISLDALVTEITTTGADAYTLADGVVGQIKIIAMIVDGGDGTLTPTTLATGTTITFNDINDNISLLYTTNGWVNTANQRQYIA